MVERRYNCVFNSGFASFSTDCHKVRNSGTGDFFELADHKLFSFSCLTFGGVGSKNIIEILTLHLQVQVVRHPCTPS